MIGGMTTGERLRRQRERVALTLGQVAEYEGVSKTYLSALEREVNSPNVWPLLARLAERYRTSADYLLGLSDDPSPRRGEALPEALRAVLELAVQWPDARQQELLDVALVLDAAEREADLREYDRIMGLLAALAEDDIATEAVESALRAHAAGDRAGALRLVEAFFAGRAAREETQEEQGRRDAKT